AALARSGGQFTDSESLLLDAAQTSERAHLFRLLPRIRLEQLSLLIHLERHDEARITLAPLWDTMREWKSDPGAARCILAAAHLRRVPTTMGLAAAPGRTDTADVDEDLRTALRLPVDVIEEILPYLRHEASWTVPLIATDLRAGGDPDRAQALLIGIGGPAVDHLIPLLANADARDRAITILGAIGDPRARRPLANLAGKRGTPGARAVQDAIRRLREPDPVSLEISMLGAFAVKRSGTAISESEWKTKKVKTLLKYLVLHRHRAVPQDELIEVLWPEVGTETGAVRMKTALKTLRQVLEPLLEGTRSSFVVRVADTLRFIDPGRCRFDLDAYDHHLADGRGYEEAGRTVEAIAALERAAELYRGDLLEEDRYEEWSAPEREVRRERHLHLLESLADLHARRRDFRRAIETAQSILILDRLREPAYRRIMRYALARGDRQTALFAYQTCERLLREELGVSPQPETRALRDQAKSPTST
ncbi:MAG TPA: bacterial transcriptional activator domain-containing protein, partial [bacterium]